VVRALVVAARSPEPRAAAVVDTALATLGREAADLAEAMGEGRADRKREALRLLVGDVLYALSVEARDVAAGRTNESLMQGLLADAGLRLLERLGALAAAVPANVTPAVVLLETARALGAELKPEAS